MYNASLNSRLRPHLWWLPELKASVEHSKFLCRRSWSANRTYEGRPNVIFLSVDSMACKHLGCYGYHRATSPNMDKLAETGVLFENVIAQSNWTKPALASIVTGLYPSVHKTDAQGETGDRVNVEVRNCAHVLDERFRTMAQEFQDGGYATAGFSNGGYAHSFFGFGRGFDVYENQAGGLKSSSYRLLQWTLGGLGKSFMAWIHAWDAHFPYMDRPPYNRKFVERRAPIRLDASIRHAINSGTRTITELEREFLCGLYDGAINYVDALIGNFVEELRNLKLLDNTFLVISADHGEAFMEHGYVEHTACLHSEVVRVPLIVVGPGLPQGRRVRSQVRSIDIMPTVLDLCGLYPKEKIQGVSLLPWITAHANGDLVSGSETERGGGQTALSDGRLKIIRKSTDKSFQVYDVLADVHEKNDISESYPDIREAMKSKLAAWENEVAFCAGQYWSESSSAEPLEMREEVVDRLKALGYVE
jgi:arylsulfatase A-like enzyme